MGMRWPSRSQWVSVPRTDPNRVSTSANTTTGREAATQTARGRLRENSTGDFEMAWTGISSCLPREVRRVRASPVRISRAWTPPSITSWYSSSWVKAYSPIFVVMVCRGPSGVDSIRHSMVLSTG